MVAETIGISSNISVSFNDGGCGESSCCLLGNRTRIHPVSSSSFKKAATSTTRAAESDHPEVMDDAVLAKELNELSFEEREKVFDDIHGVTGILQETPEFIEARVRELDRELEELPRTKRHTWDRAVFLKPSLTTDKKFKLMFLRADDYDAFKSARRLAKFFDNKAELFGEDKLVKRITLDDFDKDDMEVFQSGPYIEGPRKDSAGRPIWLSNVPKFDCARGKNLIRCAWYMAMTSLLEEDEAAQIKGVCSILYCPSGAPGFSYSISQFWEFIVMGGNIMSNLPVRTTITHFCYDNPSMEFVLSGFQRALGKENRLRLRAHYGSGVELQYKLMTYGIHFPYFLEDYTKKGGRDEKVEIHHQFIEKRIRLEKEVKQQHEQLYRVTFDTENCKRDNKLTIPYPNTNDVLVGRGCPYQTYSGNIALSEVIERQFLDRYSQATDRYEKNCLHIDVVNAIQEVHGGRFIERTGEGWKVVDAKAARKKVNSSFRSKMAKHTTSSSTRDKPTIEIGKKTKQPFSAFTLPFRPNNHHHYSNDNSDLIRWGLEDGSAKRARYDPTVVIQSHGNSSYYGDSWR